MKKPCLNCSTAFETTFDTMKFCSADCQYIFFLKSKRKDRLEDEEDNTV